MATIMRPTVPASAFVDRTYDGTMSPQWALWIAAGSLFGSVPFAWLIGRGHGIDIRRHGSGNVGATNLGRAVGRPWGALCLVLDAAKGAAPVLLSGSQMGMTGGDPAGVETWGWLGVAAAAMIGHVYPVWLGFRGGKGVATGLGVLLGFWPTLTLPAVGALLTWLLVLGLSRYVGLASIVAAVATPCYLLAINAAAGRPLAGIAPFLVVTTLMALLVVVRHRGNLVRTLQGKEPRVGQ